MKLNHFRGLSLSIVQLFSKQVYGFFALDKSWFDIESYWDVHFLWLVIYVYVFKPDIAWIGSDERCWYNSLRSETGEYPFMHKVS